MHFSNVAIEGMAHSLPEDVVSSSEIEDKLSPLYQRLNLPPGRLELMTGITERRLWPSTFKPSEASAGPGKNFYILESMATRLTCSFIVLCAGIAWNPLPLPMFTA